MAKLKNYDGSIDLISGLRQKNNGDFPLMDAHAVQIREDGTRLDVEIEEIRRLAENSGASVSCQEQDDGILLTINENSYFLKYGSDGEDGYTPVKGKDYFDGNDGVSPTITTSAIEGGNKITITDKNGTETINVMDGKNGNPGKGIATIARTSGNGNAGTTDTYTITYTDSTTSTFTVRNGNNGTDGTSVTVKNVSESATSGGSNVVTFSDDKTVTIKNGKAGKDGTNARLTGELIHTVRNADDVYALATETYARAYNSVYIRNVGDPFVLKNTDDTPTTIMTYVVYTIAFMPDSARIAAILPVEDVNNTSGIFLDFTDTLTGEDKAVFIVDGKDGESPVKGVDYFTAEDKSEIAQEIGELIDVPTKTSELTNDSGFVNETDMQSFILENKDEIASSVTEEILKPVIGYNLYNETNSSAVNNGYTGNCRRGFAFLPLREDSYKVYISSAGASNYTYIYKPNQNDTLRTTTIVVYDADGNEITDIEYSTSAVHNSTQSRSAVRVTIPAGANAAKIEFLYRITNSSGATLCSEMMVTMDTIPETYEPYEEKIVLDGLDYTTPEYVEENYISKKIYYVSTTGSDTNDGLTKETPLATLKQALTLGATKIGIEVGEYFITSGITINGLNDVHIFAYRTSENYDHSAPIRENVKITGAKYYTGYSKNSDGIYQQSEVSAGFDYNAVFVNKSKSPTVTDRTYHANLMVIHNDISKDYYLKPVLTYAECVANSNTFYWDGSTLSFNTTSTDFVKVAVIRSETGITISNCNKVILDDICVSMTKGNVVTINDSNAIIFNNCAANASALYNGFYFTDTNGTLNNCYTTKNGYDGFNFHGYGTTVMNDCIAENNYDDGCSHHDGCIGTINGGRFSGSGKAGIAPAYGANVNIYNVVAEDNPIGIGYLTTANGHASIKGIVSGCLFKNNNVGLKVESLASVTAISCQYTDNTADKQVTGILEEVVIEDKGDSYILTEADKVEIAEQVPIVTVPAKPDFVNGVAEMTDESKVYVNTETFTFWRYQEATYETTITDIIESTADNPAHDGYYTNKGTLEARSGTFVTPYINIGKYSGQIKLKVKGATCLSDAASPYTAADLCDENHTYISRMYMSLAQQTINTYLVPTLCDTVDKVIVEGDTTTLIMDNCPRKFANGNIIHNIRFTCGTYNSGATWANSEISIEYRGMKTEKIWVDTGKPYAPTITESDKQDIVQEVAALVDGELLSVIGDGEVSV